MTTLDWIVVTVGPFLLGVGVGGSIALTWNLRELRALRDKWRDS